MARPRLRIGIVGTGNVGGTLARHLARLGHSASIANSRGARTLRALAASTGATPVPVVDAARDQDVVIVAFPAKAVIALRRELFAVSPASGHEEGTI